MAKFEICWFETRKYGCHAIVEADNSEDALKKFDELNPEIKEVKLESVVTEVEVEEAS